MDFDDDDDGAAAFEALFGTNTGTFPGSQTKAVESCPTCGDVHFDETDDGYLICRSCGTQSQDIRNLEHEDEGIDEEGRAKMLHTGRLMVRRLRTGPKIQLPYGRDAFDYSCFLEAIQILLRCWADAMVVHCSAPHVFPLTLKDIWSRYLEHFSGPDAPPPVFVIGSRIVTSSHPLYVARLRAMNSHSTPPACAALSMPLLLSMVYLTCRWLAMDVLPHDLLAWVRNGTIPYLNAYGILLNTEYQVKLSSARSFLSPITPPSPAALTRLYIIQSHSTGVEPAPLNRFGCIARLIATMDLPPRLLHTAHGVLCCDEVDTMIAPLYYRRGWHKQQGATNVRRLKPDFIGRLRSSARSIDRDSAAHIAAIVAFAFRLLDNWEVWVDVHVQPGTIGSIEAQRRRVGCATGEWKDDFVKACTCAGCVPTSGRGTSTVGDGLQSGASTVLPQVSVTQQLLLNRWNSGESTAVSVRHPTSTTLESGTTPPYERRPDLPLPVTLLVDGKPPAGAHSTPFPRSAEQMAVMPSTLLPRLTRFLGLTALSGGDVGIGRGELHYPHDAYGKDAIMTISAKRKLHGAPGTSALAQHAAKLRAASVRDTTTQGIPPSSSLAQHDGTHVTQSGATTLASGEISADDDPIALLLRGGAAAAAAVSGTASQNASNDVDEVQVTLGARTDVSTTYEMSRLWPQSSLRAVAEVSEGLLTWGKNRAAVEGTVLSHRNSQMRRIEQRVGEQAATVSIVHNITDSSSPSINTSQDILLYPRYNLSLNNHSSSLHSVPRPRQLQQRYHAFLLMLAAFTDTCVEDILAHVEVLEFMFTLYVPLPKAKRRKQANAAT